MSNIFKFYINKSNTIDCLFLFIGTKYIKNNLGLPTVDKLNTDFSDFEIFKTSDIFNTFFKKDFSQQDIYNLDIFKPQIIFINDTIYLDDTIETCKLKFLKNYNDFYKDTANNICFEELYFYSIINNNLKYNTIFNILTNNNKIFLTRERLNKFLNNYEDSKELIESLPEKIEYTIDDLIYLKLIDKKILKPIGHTSFNNKANIIYNINPYNNIKLEFETKKVSETITTNNSNLLFEYNLPSNTIYLCLFTDVIDFSKKKYLTKKLSSSYIFHFYFKMI